MKAGADLSFGQRYLNEKPCIARCSFDHMSNDIRNRKNFPIFSEIWKQYLFRGKFAWRNCLNQRALLGSGQLNRLDGQNIGKNGQIRSAGFILNAGKTLWNFDPAVLVACAVLATRTAVVIW